MPGPPRMPLTPAQARVLAAAADGAPVSAVAVRLGVPRPQVAARLSEAYRRLGVSRLPVGVRRAEAVREARRRGLLAPSDTKRDTKNGCTPLQAHADPANVAHSQLAPTGAPTHDRDRQEAP